MITTRNRTNELPKKRSWKNLKALINHPSYAPSVSSSDSGDDEDDPMSFQLRDSW